MLTGTLQHCSTSLKRTALKSTITRPDIDRFLRLAEHVERAINAESFHPNDNFMCGICGYREMCGEW